MPRVDNARTRYLTPEEAQRLLNELKLHSQTWYAIAFVSLHTGMRLSEILHLEAQDVNFANGTLRIRDGKSGSRTAHMTAQICALLTEILPDRANALVFTGRNGRRLTDSDTSNTFLRSVNACGLNPEGTDARNRVSFHTLRHSYCSWLAMHGVPLYTIGELVGHSSPQMTKRYAHLCPSAAKEAARSIEFISQSFGHDAPPDSLAQPVDDKKP